MSVTKVRNPFEPHSPVNPNSFGGRIAELNAIHDALLQLENENPSHLLVLGERGIGKTSLLLFATYLAKGDLTWGDGEPEPFQFLTVPINLRGDIGLIEFARVFARALERHMNNEEKALAVVSKLWRFAQRIEIAGTKINPVAGNGPNRGELYENLLDSIIGTVETLSGEGVSGGTITSPRKGLVVLIDEADNASRDLDLGSLLKNLTESLIFQGCRRVMFIVTGLPKTKDVLLQSHKSSLRIFQEMELRPLSKTEVDAIYDFGVDSVNQYVADDERITLHPAARDLMNITSEGYPHFVQQIGHSVFNSNRDNTITEADATDGIFGEGGAIEQIGTSYYHDMYFNMIQSDAYREILQIMAGREHGWVKVEEIRKRMSYPSKLSNGLKTLCDRNIIIRKIGRRGVYKLQWIGFALWIKYYAEAQRKLKKVGKKKAAKKRAKKKTGKKKTKRRN